MNPAESARPDRLGAAAQSRSDQPAALEVEYWTDPLCCWSWACEPQLQLFRKALRTPLIWRIRLGGMIRDWNHYNDPINAIARPAQMGPLWFQARHTTGVFIDESIWRDDPPASSYPACIAVKTAELQSPLAAERYLHRLRVAVMTQRRNIARRSVLMQIAEELAGDEPHLLDAAVFANQLDAPEPRHAFREDLKQAAYCDIGRFPTFILRRGNGRGLVLVGYHPADALHQAVAQLANERA